MIEREFLRASAKSDNVPTAQQLRMSLVPAVQAAVAAWPALEVGAAALTQRVASVWQDAQIEAAQFAAWIAGLCLSDLYLALALANNHKKAVEVFEHNYVNVAVASVRGKTPKDELKQLVLERILVAARGQRPRIASYAGKGPLLAWVKAVAVRLSVDTRQDPHRQHTQDVEALSATFLAPDLELMILSSRYTADLKHALASALSSLDPRDRNLLRFHFLEGVSGDALARMYGVTRRTITRWLEVIRLTVLARTKAHLARELKLGDEELELIIGALRSQLASVLQAGLALPNRRK